MIRRPAAHTQIKKNVPPESGAGNHVKKYNLKPVYDKNTTHTAAGRERYAPALSWCKGKTLFLLCIFFWTRVYEKILRPGKGKILLKNQSFVYNKHKM